VFLGSRDQLEEMAYLVFVVCQVSLDHKGIQEKMVLRVKWGHQDQKAIKVLKGTLDLLEALAQEDREEKLDQ